MIDIKDVVIEDLKRTLSSLERTLRAAGNIEMKCYHNARDIQLAKEFIKMADSAMTSLIFADANLECV